jgi:hypothetical protein
VDRLQVESLAFIMALQDKDKDALCVLNGDRFKSKGLKPAEDGSITGLCDQVQGVLIDQLGLLVAFRGKLYDGGELDKDLNLTLKPASDEAVVALEKALAAIKAGKAKGKGKGAVAGKSGNQ